MNKTVKTSVEIELKVLSFKSIRVLKLGFVLNLFSESESFWNRKWPIVLFGQPTSPPSSFSQTNQTKPNQTTLPF